jgi:hypothetical protein
MNDSLFNDAASTVEFIQCQMKFDVGNELWVRKDLKEGGCDLFQATIPAFAWTYLDILQKISIRLVKIRPRFEPRTSRTQA